MSFGAEFRNMRSAGGAPKVTAEVAKEAETVAAEKAAAPPEAQDPDSETFAQPFTDGQTLGESTEADGTPPMIPPPKIETKKAVKINGKNFDSVEDAMEYAAELERAVEKEEAYKKGLEAAQPKEIKPAEIKKIKKIADKLFEDPDAAMEELENHFLELAEKRAEAREQKKTQEQQQVQTVKQTWDNFYKNNADLADWQDEVNTVTQREWDRLQHMESTAGLEEIANLARKYVSSIKERALPKSNLASRPAQTSGQGTKSATATPQQATEKKLSFAQQVRSTNRRTTAQGEA